ncbi:hypothetical protein O9G_000288 [Rozella allomycis CSF55]|uniref:RNA recognition motif domain-containing protein n=1 Tax=Rozella allomycis (strain CSF55) TaxID=988480 RepID=A0A075AP54_ROZAC|nr:hypothetical protein O9G_000288 [Rozella allomycis CSF55]|eukprot:EPZ31809.1 hypothetical protein O9G_000288 [Rozella allomycis CSF55]
MKGRAIFEQSDEEDVEEVKVRHDKVYKKRNAEMEAALQDLIETSATSRWFIGCVVENDEPSNIFFVFNVPESITKDDLLDEFGRFGAIGNLSFENGIWCIVYMNNQDSYEAFDRMNGHLFHNQRIALKWGPQSGVPMVPLYKHSSLGVNRIKATHLPNQSLKAVDVEIPNIKIRRIIHRTIEYVLKYGHQFEQSLMKRNPEKYFFLSDQNSKENLYSILQGDKIDRWREESFKMFHDGVFWNPPDMDMEKESFDEDSEDEIEVILETKKLPEFNDGLLKQLMEMIRNVDLNRTSISDLMVFCIKNSSFSDSISDILISSICKEISTFEKRLARLYVASDILHNAGAEISKAWKYRLRIENSLDKIFNAFRNDIFSMTDEKTRELSRMKVIHVLNVWESWSIFQDQKLKSFYTLLTETESNKTTQKSTEQEAEPKKKFKSFGQESFTNSNSNLDDESRQLAERIRKVYLKKLKFSFEPIVPDSTEEIDGEYISFQDYLTLYMMKIHFVHDLTMSIKR